MRLLASGFSEIDWIASTFFSVDLNSITEVLPISAHGPIPRGRTFSLAALNTRNSVDSPLAGTTQTTTTHQASGESDHSSLSFTLNTSSGTLVELTAPDRTTFSEWVDGLSLLRPDGLIQTKETTDYIQMLTDFGVTVRLLQTPADHDIDGRLERGSKMNGA